MKIYLGADHAGYKLKESLKTFLIGQGYTIEDCGAFSYQEGDDYPDFIKPVAEKVSQSSEENRGIVIGGSGEGEAMAANRVKGVRAVAYYGGPKAIIALSREHNNANVLSLGARFLSDEEAITVVILWLKTPFSGEERHVRRLQKMDA